jgi:hypothetical protein
VISKEGSSIRLAAQSVAEGTHITMRQAKGRIRKTVTFHATRTTSRLGPVPLSLASPHQRPDWRVLFRSMVPGFPNARFGVEAASARTAPIRLLVEDAHQRIQHNTPLPGGVSVPTTAFRAGDLHAGFSVFWHRHLSFAFQSITNPWFRSLRPFDRGATCPTGPGWGAISAGCGTNPI